MVYRVDMKRLDSIIKFFGERAKGGGWVCVMCLPCWLFLGCY